MDNENLKPCPFCGANAYFEGGVEERDDRRYFSMTVCCGSCEATITEAINFTEHSKLGERGAYQRLKEMCSAAWNSRAHPERAQPDSVVSMKGCEQAHGYGTSEFASGFTQGEMATKAALAAQPRDDVPSGMEDAWRPMEEWAEYERKDDLVFLLVDYRDGDHPLADELVTWTIGSNTDHNHPDEPEGWKFAGWCWCHDHFTEGKGKPIAWKPCDPDTHRPALSQGDEQPAIPDMTDAECATAYRDLRRRANDAGFATVGEWIDEQPDTDGEGKVS